MLVSDLSSPALQELGLAEAISDWAGVFMKSQFGIKTSVINRLEQADTNLLDDPIRAILFRNIREILVNVIKHSQASHVDVFIERNDDKLVVTVRDDGRGCDSNEANQDVNKDSGFGLFSIRERMADLGGALETESQAGEGYTARLVMPL
jgi:signal transduction histidine kinase